MLCLLPAIRHWPQDMYNQNTTKSLLATRHSVSIDGFIAGEQGHALIQTDQGRSKTQFSTTLWPSYNKAGSSASQLIFLPPTSTLSAIFSSFPRYISLRMPNSEPQLSFYGVYPQWIFSAFSFMGFIMCLIPLKWHLRLGNTGACLYMLWAGIGCLNWFINSIIWRDDAINRAPVWCDICEFSSRLYPLV
jgi:hypothetical protein